MRDAPAIAAFRRAPEQTPRLGAASPAAAPSASRGSRPRRASAFLRHVWQLAGVS